MIAKKQEQKETERPRIKPPAIPKRPAPPASQARALRAGHHEGTGDSNRESRTEQHAPSKPARKEPGNRPAHGRAHGAAPAPRRDQHAPRERFSSKHESSQAHESKPRNIESNKDAVRFVPLGGLEEVGRNCMFLEYKNEIVLIDVGQIGRASCRERV